MAEADRLKVEIGSEPQVVIQHLMAPAGRDWVGGSRESLRLRRTVVRQFSRQYWFDVEAGPSSRGIVVKVCDRRTTRRPRAEQLPLTPPSDFDWGSRAEREHDAFLAIARHFDAVNDQRFGVVRALGFIPELNAVVTERIDDVIPLKRPFRLASRLHPLPAPRLLPVALANAGAWLREYQRCPVPGGAIRATRDDFLAASEQLCHTLVRSSGHEDYLRGLLHEMEAAAQTLLPSALATGAAHGDFGQSNVLVAGDQRIFVLDTAAGWQVPVLEDLAYFLVGIESSRIQVQTGGLAFSSGQVAAARRAFLEGYLGQGAVPEGLALYEALLVLDRWVAQLGKLDGGVRSAVKRRMVNAWFRRHSARLMSSLG